jgi:hypothetical protein
MLVSTFVFNHFICVSDGEILLSTSVYSCLVYDTKLFLSHISLISSAKYYAAPCYCERPEYPSDIFPLPPVHPRKNDRSWFMWNLRMRREYNVPHSNTNNNSFSFYFPLSVSREYIVVGGTEYFNQWNMGPWETTISNIKKGSQRKMRTIIVTDSIIFEFHCLL